MKKFLSVVAGLTALAASVPSSASASHDWPLAGAASNYRAAVLHFGEEVNHDHHLSRGERRVAFQLVDACNSFYGLSRHPQHQHLLQDAWFRVEVAHRQVEAVLFHDPHCPAFVHLRPCWEELLCAQRDVLAILVRLGCYGHLHDHGHHHDYEPGYGYPGTGRPGTHTPPTTHVPAAVQQSYRYRDAVVPSYRYGNYGHQVVPPTSRVSPSPSKRQVQDSVRQSNRSTPRQQLDVGKVGAIVSRFLQ